MEIKIQIKVTDMKNQNKSMTIIGCVIALFFKKEQLSTKNNI